MKVQIITNLYPLPWEPNRASFNKQQFDYLVGVHDVRVTVVVAWLSYLTNLARLRRSRDSQFPLDFVCYFYVPLALRFTYALSLFVCLLFKLRKFYVFRPDCLLLSWAYPDAVAGTLIARILKIPAVIKVHGSDINVHALYKSRARQIRWSMKHAGAVVSVSQDLADKLEEIGVDKGKISVIYNGVDHELFQEQDRQLAREKLKLDTDARYILFVGNLKKEKGCLDLLEAFFRIARDESSLKLVFVGSGPMADEIRTRTAQESLGDAVILAGSRRHVELADWFNACDIVSLPSYNEGVPNVLLEAMACGIPVVATRVGGIPEVVPECAGILTRPGDRTDLADGLKRALAISWDRQAVADSVAEFSWERNTRQLSQLLESVTGKVRNADF